MPYPCRPLDESFLNNPPAFFYNEVELPASSTSVFQILADEKAWPQWFDEIREVVWTSPKPFTVGTTRTVTLNTMTVWEHFFIWEENRRFAFYFTQTSLPLARAFAEDYQLEPLGHDRCRFRWRVCYEPTLILRLTGPIGRYIFGRMFRRATAGLAAFVRSHHAGRENQ